MVIREAALFIFEVVPLLRRLWHWIWERHMELEWREPHSQIVRGPAGLNIPDETGPIFTVNVGEKPSIHMYCDLVITNHSEKRPEVITNCELHLKIRHWLLWERTIASAPVLVNLVNKAIRPQQKAWKPIELAPLSLPTIIPVWAQGDIAYPIGKLPRRMRLVLEVDTVGRPYKRVRKPIRDFTHSAS